MLGTSKDHLDIECLGKTMATGTHGKGTEVGSPVGRAQFRRVLDTPSKLEGDGSLKGCRAVEVLHSVPMSSGLDCFPSQPLHDI